MLRSWVWIEPGDASGSYKILTSVVYKVAPCPGAKAHSTAWSSELFKLIKKTIIITVAAPDIL